jgi:hypothetical protein
MSRTLPADFWITRDERHAVYLDGVAQLRDGRELTSRVCNLSSSGCLMETEDRLPIGEVFTLMR